MHSLEVWDRGLESNRQHECLSLVFVCEGVITHTRVLQGMHLAVCDPQKHQNEAVYARFGCSASDAVVAAAEKGGRAGGG